MLTCKKKAEEFEAFGTARFLSNPTTGEKKNLTEFAFMNVENDIETYGAPGKWNNQKAVGIRLHIAQGHPKSTQLRECLFFSRYNRQEIFRNTDEINGKVIFRNLSC